MKRRRLPFRARWLRSRVWDVVASVASVIRVEDLAE